MDLITGLTLMQVLIGLLSLLIVASAITIIVKINTKKQIQKSGDNSISIQSGGHTKIKS